MPALGLGDNSLTERAVFDGERTVIEEMHAGLEEVARMREQLHVLAVRMGELGGAELIRVLAYHENNRFFLIIRYFFPLTLLLRPNNIYLCIG